VALEYLAVQVAPEMCAYSIVDSVRSVHEMVDALLVNAGREYASLR
jgi:hypothetical protein